MSNILPLSYNVNWCILACFLHVIPTSTQLLKARDNVVPGFEKEDHSHWDHSYIFVQGSDPQPGLIDQISGGNGTQWAEDIKRLRMAVSVVNNMTIKPAFLMITGDLVNAFPGQEPYKGLQTNDVLACLNSIKVPTFVISGNHDLLNTPTNNSIQEYRNQYGDDFYSFYYGGVMYIALNSQYFYNSSEVRELAQEQMDWLEKQLVLAKSDVYLKHIVIFMHIPLFIHDGNEADSYFNIHSPLREELINKFMNAGVKIVFSGHYHRNAGGIYTVIINDYQVGIESVVSSAIGAQLGKDKSGLRIVNVQEDEVTHKYYDLDDMPENHQQLMAISVK